MPAVRVHTFSLGLPPSPRRSEGAEAGLLPRDINYGCKWMVACPRDVIKYA
jgi:hypothetical protein